MNIFRKFSLIFFICGLITIVHGVNNVTMQVGFFLIFPIIFGSSLYAFFGFVLIVISLFLFTFDFYNKDIVSIHNQINKEGYITKNNKIHKGGVILIGPIPILLD